MFRLLAILVLFTSSLGTSFAGPATTSESLGFFGGVFSKSQFPGDANIPFAGEIESNYLIGTLFHKDFTHLGAGFFVGGEVGLALRFGEDDPTSLEAFAGPTFRHRGLDIGPINIAPRLTIGLSAVTDTIGIARRRARTAGTEGTLLFYLGPELSFSLKDAPQTEVFYRTQHRSGLNGTLENMGAGHNAHVFGVRRNF